LPRRFAPRSDAEELREYLLQLSNSPTLISSADARHRPVFTAATGRAGRFLFLASRKGACGTLGEEPHPRRLAELLRASRTPFEDQRHTGGGPILRVKIRWTEPGPRTQIFTCVPHTDGFVGLLDVPGMAAAASVPPFVRAVARTCTRAVRPLRRGLPRPPSGPKIDPQNVPGPASLRTSASRSTRRRPSLRAPYRYGTD
jgi:hypothetical protein